MFEYAIRESKRRNFGMWPLVAMILLAFAMAALLSLSMEGLL